MKPTHMMVLGTTQAGKTTYTNQLHMRFRRISVFVDTKGIDPLWGVKVRSLNPLSRTLLAGKKIVWDPPRGADGIAWERADAELLAFWVKVQETAQRAGWTSERPPWIQLIVDESQMWESEDSKRPRTLEDIAARGLGMGCRLVLVTQYPSAMRTKTRGNLETRVVFRLADEGRRCIRGWGWPADEITEWTRNPYHFATYAPIREWQYHRPIKPSDYPSR